MSFKKALPWFIVFNFIIYISVFMGRIIRDSYLFTQEYGEQIFPLVLILNAIIITYVSSRLDEWDKKLGRKLFFAFSFLGSALFFLIFGVLSHPKASIWFPLLEFIPRYKLIAAFIFYLFAETPIFLSMNLIWIITADYFTEQQGQKDYPKISSFGLLGISIGAVLTLLSGKYFPLYYLNFLWSILCILLFIVSFYILTYCQKLPVIEDVTVDEEISEETKITFIKWLQGEFKWMYNYRFMWLFCIVTICNFALLAIFDQTLANGAIHIGLSGESLSEILAWFTLVFGIGATFFQYYKFPKILDKKGVARVNMYAPGFMFLGAVCYLLFASDFLEPVWKLLNINTEFYLLHIIIGARITGWIAEYLFNQSMLPFVYGAMPSQDESRGRFLIEGPVTALTNGSVGLFLLLYFQFFKTGSVGYGYKLDLLFVIALVTSGLMWIWSRQMIPEFRKVLRKRAMEGELSDEKINIAYRPDLVDDIGLIETELKSSKKDTKRFPKQLKLLRLSHGANSIPQLKKYALAPDIQAENRAEAIKQLVSLNAVESFEDIYIQYEKMVDLPHSAEIDAIGIAAKELGHTSRLKNCFEKWLRIDSQDKEKIRIILKHLSSIGLDGALIVGKYIDTYPDKFAYTNALSEMDLYVIAAELGSDRFYPKLAEAVRKDELIDWQPLSNIDFYDHKNVLDAFALLLPHIEDRKNSAFRATLELMNKHKWLCWPIFSIIEYNTNELPGHLSIPSSILPILSAQSCLAKNTPIDEETEIIDFPISSLIFFDQIKKEISENWAIELMNINWDILNEKNIRKKFPIEEKSEGLNYRQYLIDRLEHPETYAKNIAQYLAFAQSLFDLTHISSESRKLESSILYAQKCFRQSFILWHIFAKFGGQATDWNQRRARQWLECFLLLNVCKYPKTKDSISYGTAKAILLPEEYSDAYIGDLDVVNKDKTISKLEQSDLPRDVFTELRADLDNIKDIIKNPNLRKIYLGENLTIDRLPSHEKEANKLWQQLIPNINDQLLKTIHH